MRRFLNSVALGGACLLTACSGSPTESSDGGGGGRVVVADPSFATHVLEIIDRRGCASSRCHAGPSPSASLDLSPGRAYAALVGVRARSESAIHVIPGNANDSYLVIRLEGRQTAGSRMPLGGSPVDSIDLRNIRNWIDRGALNN